MAEALGTIGGYVLEAKLGEGGMGAVFKATHPSYPGRAFALKVILDQVPDPEAVVRFRREMDTLAKASLHPGIVRVFGGTVDGDRPFFVMELAQGKALHDLAKGKPLEPRRAARIVRQIADGVAHIHGLGIVHRDLKPQNVIVSPDDTAKILDFGLVKVAGASRLTKTGASMGTPAYSAPEQLDGSAKEARPVADVYALGGILYFALTGRDPFEGEGTSVSLLKRVLTDPATPPSWAQRGVPRELDAVCLRALEKNAAARYESAAALRDDLDRFAKGEPVSVHLPGAGERAARWARRHAFRIVALGLVLAATVGTGVYVAVSRAREASKAAKAADDVAQELASAKRAKTAAEVAGPLEHLEKFQADPDHRNVPDLGAAVQEARRCRLLARGWDARRKLAAAGRLDPSELEGLRSAANELPAATSLVGELAEAEFSVGDALLDAHEARLVDFAADLAGRRLASNAGDLAARALRAYASLERSRAPTRPLGAGRLGHVPSDQERGDLAAAAGIPGEPGARAAWLLADLLACAGPAAAGDATAALEKAVARAPEHAARAVLESALAASWNVGGFTALRDKLGAEGADANAALALSRFFAHAGEPEVVDHPELVGATDAADLARRIRAALAGDDPGAYRPRPFPPSPPELDPRTLDALNRLTEALGKTFAAAAREGEPFDPVLANILACVCAQIPRGFLQLYHSGYPEFTRRAAAVHTILTARHSGSHGATFAVMFSQAARGGTAAMLEYERERRALDPHAEKGKSDTFYYPPEVWETSLRGAAACAAFDAALEADVSNDPFLQVALGAASDPLPAGDVRDAISAARGLRRVEELAEASDLEATERTALAFDALRQLEDLRRLGGPEILVDRARLRTLAFPGRLGAVLARLDLERLLALASQRDTRAEAASLGVSWANTTLVAAAYATALPSAASGGVARELYQLGVWWAHEDALGGISGHPEMLDMTRPLPEREEAYVKHVLGTELQEVTTRSFYRPLVELAGTGLERDFDVAPADRPRFGKPFEPHLPPAAPGR